MAHLPLRLLRPRLILLGLIWMAFALRVGGLTAQSLWRDEVDTLRFASRPLADLLPTFARIGENGPLFFLGLKPWLAVAGPSEIALRFPSALAGTLAVAISYVLLCRLTGETGTALVLAALMATAPYAVWYGQEAKMYALLTALVPLALYLTLLACQQGRWWRWTSLYLITSACFYTHLLAALIVPVQAVWLLLCPALRRAPAGCRTQGCHGEALPAESSLNLARSAGAPSDVTADVHEPVLSSAWFRRRLPPLAYLSLLVLPYLPLARWQLPMLLAADSQTGYPFVGLGDILLVLLVAFSRGIVPVTQPVTLVPAMLAALVGVSLWATRSPSARAGRSGTRWPVIALLALWLLLPPLGLYAISLRRPIFADRYLIWTLPAFLALMALGVQTVKRSRRSAAGAALAIVLALNLASVWAQTCQPIKADWRAAAQYVSARYASGDLLLFQIPYNRYTFSYYSGELGPWLDGPYTNHGASLEEVAEELSRGTAGHRTVWLIASEVPMWDERRLTERWLATHGTRTDHAEFARIAVSRYVLAPE